MSKLPVKITDFLQIFCEKRNPFTLKVGKIIFLTILICLSDLEPPEKFWSRQNWRQQMRLLASNTRILEHADEHSRKRMISR